MPYLYTVAWDAVHRGIPPVRPVFWDDPLDQALWDIDDQFQLGDTLLVAPIVQQGEVSRRIKIPAGRWYSYWDDQTYSGPDLIEVPVNSETIPLFIKAGKILPIEKDTLLELHIYPENTSKTFSHLYTDAGDGYGAWRIDRFEQNSTLDSLEITWSKDGLYPFVYPHVRIQCHGKKVIQVLADGIAYRKQDNFYILPIFDTLKLKFAEY